MDYKNTPVHLNTTRHRFEMNIDDEYAIINYKQAGDTFYLIHTEVPEALEGKGIAATLVEKTLHYLEEHQQKMMPLCSYVQHYLHLHPEWNKIVAED